MHKRPFECNDPEFFNEVASQADDLTIALNNGGTPYVVTVNFVYLGGKLYFHSSPKGLKMELIARDGRIGFNMVCDVTISREKSTAYYKSLCGTGQARIVTDLAEKGRVLDAIATRYHAACPLPTPENTLAHVAVVCIDIETLTGKRRLPHPEA